MKKTFCQMHWEKALELENYLDKNQYFSKNCLPGVADAYIYKIFANQFPCRTRYPMIFYWFINIKQFTPEAIRSWRIQSENDIYFQNILKQFREMEKNQNFNIDCILQKQGQSAQVNNVQTFSMSIIFKNDAKQLIQQLRNLISRHAQIINWAYIDCEIKLSFQCQPQKVQIIKGHVVQFEEVIQYNFKKQKFKKSLYFKQYKNL